MSVIFSSASLFRWNMVQVQYKYCIILILSLGVVVRSCILYSVEAETKTIIYPHKALDKSPIYMYMYMYIRVYVYMYMYMHIHVHVYRTLLITYISLSNDLHSTICVSAMNVLRSFNAHATHNPLCCLYGHSTCQANNHC